MKFQLFHCFLKLGIGRMHSYGETNIGRWELQPNYLEGIINMLLINENFWNSWPFFVCCCWWWLFWSLRQGLAMSPRPALNYYVAQASLNLYYSFPSLLCGCHIDPFSYYYCRVYTQHTHGGQKITSRVDSLLPLCEGISASLCFPEASGQFPSLLPVSS